MNGGFIFWLTHNLAAQRRGAFHRLSGAGVRGWSIITSMGPIRGGRAAPWLLKGDAERWRGLSFSYCRRLDLLFRGSGSSKRRRA